MKNSYQTLNLWFRFLSETSHIFSNKLKLTQVTTPNLVLSPGIEEHIEVFKVSPESGKKPINYGYLATSPEFALKKLLGLGFQNIFEISPSFRFEEHSKHHSPEFTMLEWYRVGSTLEVLIDDIKQTVSELFESGFVVGQKPKIYRTTFSQEFKNKLNFDLKPSSTKEDLAQLCKKIGLYYSDEDSFDDLFHRVVLDKIEGAWPKDQMTVISDFPPSGSALAIINNDGWADRFEVYWKGLELGNAYNELLDVTEQERRFNATNSKRVLKGWESLPIDKELSLQVGKIKKPTAGIAVGLERLFMACQDIKDISLLR